MIKSDGMRKRKRDRGKNAPWRVSVSFEWDDVMVVVEDFTTKREGHLEG